MFSALLLFAIVTPARAEPAVRAPSFTVGDATVSAGDVA